MSFHLGKPILVMVVVAAITGAAIWLRPARAPRADLVVWVFAESHSQSYRGDGAPSTRPTLVETHRERTGKSVDVTLISYRALNVRLVSMFMADARGEDLPDLAEVEISQVGKYFRPPLAEVGFLPLDGFLKSSGWYDKLPRSRLTPWSKEGVIFGVPHDVHPVTLTYNKELFDQAGVTDLENCRTWAQFQSRCLDAQAAWRKAGIRNRWAIELYEANSGYLVTMLLQRGINLVDDRGNIYFDDPKVAQTLAFYAQLIAGKKRIAAEGAAGDAVYSQDFAQGRLAAFLTPDWRVGYTKHYAPGLAGKLRMMPMPVFDEGDKPTSTYGGTMIGIPRRCRDPQAAWKLIEFLYFSREGIDARRKYTDILPPVKEMWQDPQYRERDPFFAGDRPGDGGQKVGELFVNLADQIPERYVSPATTVAESTLTYILIKAINHVKSHGPGGLEQACAAWLKDGAQDLRRRIEQGKFE